MKIYKYTILLCVAVLTILIAFIIYQNKSSQIGGDFNLQFRQQQWNFAKNAKKLNLIYFGYAKCPDVCPLSLSAAGQAFRQLEAKYLDQVQLVFVSVDQANDNAEDVADFASQFFTSFIGLTGTAEQIKTAADLYHVVYIMDKDPKSFLGYSISHTDRIFFVDENGFVQDSITHARDPNEILNKIKGLL